MTSDGRTALGPFGRTNFNAPMDPEVNLLLACLVGPCPTCGNGVLLPVSNGRETNLLCRECGSCWHADHALVRRVDAPSCPGCPERGPCLAQHLPVRSSAVR